MVFNTALVIAQLLITAVLVGVIFYDVEHGKNDLAGTLVLCVLCAFSFVIAWRLYALNMTRQQR